jgi:hypothetical protein
MGEQTVRLRIHSINLVGAERVVDFTPGLNIVAGPIASGKTTLAHLIRFVLGASLGSLPPEPKRAVSQVIGHLALGDADFTVARQLVSTADSKVDIAGESDTWRLPASAGRGRQTYVDWLLTRLDLPRLEVPSAPTKVESEPTPVSIGDYLLYSYLKQDELGFAVFGHTDPFKNIKRKYVFEIVYGYYDVRVARLQESLREVLGQLRQLSSQEGSLKAFFEGTALGNRAELESRRLALQAKLEEIEAASTQLATKAAVTDVGADLTRAVLELELRTARLGAAIEAEAAGLANASDVISQLESQSAKLTRAIVSGKYFVDMDFILCPRCGTAVDNERSPAGDHCYLCLQVPGPSVGREALVKEQDAVDAQLTEAEGLERSRRHKLDELREDATNTANQLAKARQELEFHRSAFVSSHAEEIASAAEIRAMTRSQIAKTDEYLAILEKLDHDQQRKARLVDEREKLQQELAAASDEVSRARILVGRLEHNFNQILERFRPPAFGEEQVSTIDRTTYLPIYHGRRFESLSSPGLGTLVTIAYALAHHITAMEEGLKLPGFLLIDGLSEHLGQEGLDPERIGAIYDYLIEVSGRSGNELQVIVIDNEVPDAARPYIRLQLSETERLIPKAALTANDPR